MSKTKIVLLSIAGVFAVVALFFVITIASQGARFWTNKLDVQYEQYSDEAALEKYELFKNMHSALSAKKADIVVAEATLKTLEDAYTGVARKDWASSDRDAWNIRSSEIMAIKLSYNDLAASYNAAMSKDNYRFANRGSLPAGAAEPLPREYVLYITQ